MSDARQDAMIVPELVKVVSSEMHNILLAVIAIRQRCLSKSLNAQGGLIPRLAEAPHPLQNLTISTTNPRRYVARSGLEITMTFPTFNPYGKLLLADLTNSQPSLHLPLLCLAC
jgi:hypothetical protein